MNADSILAGARAFAEAFIPFLLTALSVVAGFFVIYSAIAAIFRKGGDGRSSSPDVGWGSIAVRLLVGGLLLRFGATVEDLSVLITGETVQDYRGVLAYSPIPASAGPWIQVFEVCLLWVVMLGWAGAFRGLLLFNKATNGGGGGGSAGDLFWQGTWHLIGGALAVNMAGAINSFIG
jgi:hypothetical protein